MTVSVETGAVCVLLMMTMSLTLLVPFQGSALRYNMDTNLSSADASVVGGHPMDRLGHSVDGAGDVNGDGYDDWVIGAFGVNEGAANSGAVYIFFGRDGAWTKDTNISKANASYKFEHAYQYAGYNVAGVGDVNGDGFDDVLVSAHFDAFPGPTNGKVYLIFGKTSGWAKDGSLSYAEASFIGENGGDEAGYGIGGAGDVNGDGFDDILIGAPRNSEGGSGAGQTYLIFGKSSGWGKNTPLSQSDASFWGEHSNDWAGRPATGAGDVNGDGFDDIYIGAKVNSEVAQQAGKGYIIFGKRTGWAMDTNLSTADASFRGEAIWDSAGDPGTGVGDVNGDGFDDVLIGSYANAYNGQWSGQAYLIFGKSSGWTKNVSLSQCDASFVGDAAWASVGGTLGGAGDVNGDGYDDMVIGAAGPGNAGEIYLVLGKPSGWVKHASISTASASFIGEHAQDSAAFPTGAGDVNMDGYDDITIGASNNGESGSAGGEAYLLVPDTNTKPSTIDAVKAFDMGYTKEISYAKVNDTIFVQLEGTDGNATRQDVALVKVVSSLGDKAGYQLRLYETGLNTGIYRGDFKIKDRSHERYRWLKAAVGETVTISAVWDPAKTKMISIVGSAEVLPKLMTDVAVEDAQYQVHFWALDETGATWTFSSNADWLNWDSAKHNVSGTPDNADVGTYYVKLNITTAWTSNELNYSLEVQNVAPNILTTDVPTATEETLYQVHYTSDDDGQGTITWHLHTNASWLKINTTTNNITGTPTNDDTGQFWANVSVDDGNGGMDSSNFTLTVGDRNDAPVITTVSTTVAVEEVLYSQPYTATDVDHVVQTLTWGVTSNATWLKMNTTSGELSGLPTNDDVGKFWVNVTVSDGRSGSAYDYFILTVMDINDPPVITTADVTTVEEDLAYSVKYTAADIDHVPQVMTWSLKTDASWLKLNSSTGVLSGTPTNDDVGKYQVNITVSDGRGGNATHLFNLTVLNVNDPPVITSSPNLTAVVGKAYNHKVVATDPDTDDTLEYVLRTAPEGMIIDKATGALTWTPTAAQVGAQKVVIKVMDTHTFVEQAFNVTVFIRPTITSSPSKTTVTAGEDFEYQMAATDQDVGDVLTYSMSGAPTGMTMDPATGRVLWKPGSKQVGSHTVTFKVTDKQGLSDEQTITILVKKKTSPSGVASMLPILLIVIIIVVIVAIVVMMVTRKKDPTPKNDEEHAEDEPQDTDEQDQMDQEDQSASDPEAEVSEEEEDVEEF